MRKIRNNRENKPLSIINYLFLPCSSFLLILLGFLSLGSPTNRVFAVTPQPLSSTEVVLTPGMTGSEVQVLQIQLKALGFYQDAIDGKYGVSTKNAVIQFQKARGLNRIDGIADITTQYWLTQVISGKADLQPTPEPTPQNNLNPNITANTNTNNIQNSKNEKKDFIWKSLLGLGLLVTLGAVLYLGKKLGKFSPPVKLSTVKLLSPASQNDDDQEISFLSSQETTTIPVPTDLVPLETNRLISPQLNTCEELMAELRCDNAKKRRKAIWKLGQDGDSRAVKPLLDLMIDADSEQQSLIVSTLAEIGTRTLKPMNRALAISIQDENPQVRKNAIRDLVRVYDMMGKMSKILLYAMEDPDPEVQETAKYALGQMNRIRTVPEQQILTELNTEDS
jgi:peptidoglycan hydrolase-like protein with peptidoglycan-binding domain